MRRQKAMKLEKGSLNKVTHAVVPVAGFGSRMLPATKAIPKEMLPIVDKPVIQYIVEECAKAGIKEIVLITHNSKKAIENHFCEAGELEATLSGNGKADLLNAVQNTLPDGVKLTYVQQGKAKGLGHAVLCGREVIGNNPFVVILPDVLIDEYKRSDDIDNLGRMVNNYEESGVSQIMVELVATEDISKFGIADIGGVELTAGESSVLKRVVEKPSVDEAPSNLAIVGRYVFSPSIWDLLETTTPGVGGEIQLTDAMDELIKSETMDAYYMTGESHDCGNKVGYLKAILAYASRHPETKDTF